MEWLETYQNLVVGFGGVIVGFVGSMMAVMVNAWVALNQRRDEIEHDQSMLRRALVHELKINLEQLQWNLDSLSEQPAFGHMGTLFPTDLMEDAYRSFVGRVGLLPDPDVRAVMRAYLYLRTFNARLFLLGGAPETGSRHVKIPPRNLPQLKAELEGAVSLVKQAHEELIGAVDTR